MLASFIIIPMIAILYAGLAPHGPNCGTSGQLDINPLMLLAERQGVVAADALISINVKSESDHEE